MTKGKAGASADDLAMLEQSTPYVRSVLAFLIYLRYTSRSLDDCYKEADRFIQRLIEDVKG